MKDINQFVIVGRLTRDASLETKGDYNLAKFSVAVNRGKDAQGNEKTSFFEVEMWGKYALSVAPIMKQGRQVIVTGELNQDRWLDGDKTRTEVTLKATNLQVVGKKDEDKNTPSSKKAEPVTPEEFPDEDIPF